MFHDKNLELKRTEILLIIWIRIFTHSHDWLPNLQSQVVAEDNFMLINVTNSNVTNSVNELVELSRNCVENYVALQVFPELLINMKQYKVSTIPEYEL